MAPFTRKPVCAACECAIDDMGPANAGAENNGKDGLGPLCSAVGEFRERQTVGIVGDANRLAESRFEILLKALPIEQVELALRTRPSWGESDPGMPIPTAH